MPTVYFDMDGTIADLYGPEDWLNRLLEGDETLYRDAKPLGDTRRLLMRLKRAGYRVGVVSWLARSSTRAFDARVRDAKRRWLYRHFPLLDEVHIIRYGTPKRSCVNDKQGILIDDEARNVDRWKAAGSTAYLVRGFEDVERVVERLVRRAGK